LDKKRKINPTKEGYDAEIKAYNILKKLGFEIIYAPAKSKEAKKRTDATRDKKRIDINHTTVSTRELWQLGYMVDYVDAHAKNRPRMPQVEKKKLVPKMIEVHIGGKIRRVHDLRTCTEPLTRVEEDRRDELISIWNKLNDARNALIDKITKPQNLMTKILGKQTIPETVKKAMIMGFQKYSQRHPTDRISQWKIEKIKNDEYYLHTYVDIFCKKGKEYYCFDVKNRNFKENIKQLNQFDMTSFEVFNYDRIQSTKKEVKLKIMIIIKKGKETIYKIFDWSDFEVPKKYSVETNTATKVKLKDGLKLETFTKF
jgi:Holliday junction resolvase